MSTKTEKVLTVKIAQKAVANRDSDLSEYTKIEESAAEVLANYEGYVQLDGISQLPEPLAQVLAKHKGGLSLGGVSKLSDEAAALLSNRQGSLALDGLKTLSKESALHLIKRPESLYLNGLKDISDELLEILVANKEVLSLNSFIRLSPENAKLFSEHQGGGLFLGDFKRLSPDIARILARHSDHLALGIEDLSDELLDIFDKRDEEVPTNVGDYRTTIRSLDDIEKVAKAKYSDDRESIVSLSFEYCDVKYNGFRIMKKGEIRSLVAALNTGAKIGTPNMPGEWFEEFDISLLKDCFGIHSPWPSYIQAMRKVFFCEESVGETSLFDSVLEHAPSSDD